MQANNNQSMIYLISALATNNIVHVQTFQPSYDQPFVVHGDHRTYILTTNGRKTVH